MSRSLAAAVHQEEDWYVARCLEVEVASQGRTIQEALANLSEAAELHLEETGNDAEVTPMVTSFQVPCAA